MYKIIRDNKVVDVVKYPRFIKFLSSGHIAITNKGSAEGIVGSDSQTIYSLAPVPSHDFLVVSLAKIHSEKEFRRLQSLLNSNQDIYADETALEKAKRAKIHSLSNQCKNKIISGFSIKLSSGDICDFKLTVEDQLNLMHIENQLLAGESSFIYHATDRPCQIYLREDMINIIKAYKAHTLYHTTYFNAVKQYIKSLTDIEKVNLFNYGTDIKDTVNDPVLKQILKNGGNYQ